jgi:hypothetical protein
LSRASVGASYRQFGGIARNGHVVAASLEFDGYKLRAFAAFFVAHLAAIVTTRVLSATKLIADVFIVTARVTELLARVTAFQSVLTRQSAATITCLFSNVKACRDHGVVFRVVLTAQLQCRTNVVLHHHHVYNVLP